MKNFYSSFSKTVHSGVDEADELRPRLKKAGLQSIRHMSMIAKRVILCTVKPVLSGHSKIDKTKVLKTDGSLMQVESVAECLEHSAILLTCIKR